MKVIKFYSESCGPCKVLESNLNALNIEHENFNIEDENTEELLAKYNVKGIPTLIILTDKEEVIKRHVGLLNINDLKKLYEDCREICNTFEV
jgi:thiol-disulfide isomerase/thioredoxin